MKTLRILLKHEMISLEPNGYNTDSSSATVILKGTICQSLVKLNRNMEFEPELAESWTVSDDHRVFRFRLRSGVRFHNGTALDAQIVVWNFRRLFDTLSNSLLAEDYKGLISVEEVAPLEVEFRFDKPNLPFLHNLAWRTHIVANELTQPVGTGPFKAVEWVRQSHLTLERFADYWETGLPKVDKVEFRWAPDTQDCIDVITRGGADIVESVPAAAAAGLEQKGLLTSVGIASPRKTIIAFNCMAAPFNDVRMRRAVAHAVDRQVLIDAIFGARGHIVNGVLPASDPWAVPLTGARFDPELARQLVKEAGYAEGVNIQAVMTNVAPVPKVAGMIIHALREVGIFVDVRGFDDPPWWPYLYLQGQWQLAFQGASARPHIHTLFARDIVSNGPFNPGRFSNQRLDALIDEARSCIDLDQQKRLYGEAQSISHDEVAVLPLYAADVFSGYRPGVSGFEPHPLGYLDLRHVTVD